MRPKKEKRSKIAVQYLRYLAQIHQPIRGIAYLDFSVNATDKRKCKPELGVIPFPLCLRFNVLSLFLSFLPSFFISLIILLVNLFLFSLQPSESSFVSTSDQKQQKKYIIPNTSKFFFFHPGQERQGDFKHTCISIPVNFLLGDNYKSCKLLATSHICFFNKHVTKAISGPRKCYNGTLGRRI